MSCSGLEALWESAGGSPGAAFMAAEIARAESGGRQYATDDDGNGTVDRGYWQVNSINGAGSTYDPAGNARAAVQISGDGTNWMPLGHVPDRRLPGPVLATRRNPDMTLSAAAASMPALNLSSLIPLAVVALVVYLLHRSGMQLWHAIVCLSWGSSSPARPSAPDISSILSQLSGGHLH